MLRFLAQRSPYFFLAIITILSLWRLFAGDGLPVGHDLSFEMVRLAEYKEALGVQLFPRYAPHTYSGLGSPVFTFYAPLFTFAASILSMVFGTLSAGVIAWFLLLKTVSVFCVYRIFHTLGSLTAFLIALIWCFLPYGYIDLYTRNAFSEASALFLLPIVSAGILYVWHTSKVGWKHFLCLTGISTLFLLSHNLTIVMSALFATLGISAYIIFKLAFDKKNLYELIQKKQRQFISIGGSTLCAFALSSWFLLPVLLEKHTVQLEELTTGKFAYHLHFSTLNDLLNNIGGTHFVGWITLIAVIFGAGILVYLLLRKQFQKPDTLLLSGVLLTSSALFMMTASSNFIWENISFLAIIQFPWRFQIFVSLGLTLLLAGIFRSLRKQHWISFLMCFGIMIQSIFVTWSAYQVPSVDYANFDQLNGTSIARNGLRATVGDEYLPVSFNMQNLPKHSTPFFSSERTVTTKQGVLETTFTSCPYGRQSRQPATLIAYPFISVETGNTPVMPENGLYIIGPSTDCTRVHIGISPMQLLGLQLAGFSIIITTIAGLFSLKKKL